MTIWIGYCVLDETQPIRRGFLTRKCATYQNVPVRRSRGAHSTVDGVGPQSGDCRGVRASQKREPRAGRVIITSTIGTALSPPGRQGSAFDRLEHALDGRVPTLARIACAPELPDGAVAVLMSAKPTHVVSGRSENEIANVTTPVPAS